MPSALVGHMMNKRKEGKLGKPRVTLEARVSMADDPMIDAEYDREEMKRCKARVKALKKAIADFDPEEASKQAKRSLMRELGVSQARLAEHKARMGEVGDDGESD